MDGYLIVATRNGVVTLERRGNDFRDFAGALLDHRFTSAASDGENILAGTADGIYHSADLGRTWHAASEGLTERYVRWLAFHPDDRRLALAGTEPANIFRSEDGGHSWYERPEVARMRDEHGWDLPYSPAAGCIRGFALQGDRAYAAAEQGGFLRSDSRGAVWYLPQGSNGSHYSSERGRHQVHPDVHSVLVHPSSSDQVYAATGGGLFYSTDGGSYWDWLYRCYCRAVWVDPARPAHIILGPADGVDRGGRIEESIDGGHNWTVVMNGLEGPWANHMVERFHQIGNELFAVLSNGRLIAASLDTLHWQPVLPAVENVTAVAWLPE
ncbi:MAG: hypothetical protein R2844_12700 [Caldilineales bacterium]